MTDRDELGKTVPRVTGENAAHTPGRQSLPPQQEGRYAVPDGVKDPELARGGMGRVLSLHDTHLKREVAVKELLAEHTAERSSTGPLLENLFIREAQVLARLEHPGVVPVYELGRRSDGTPYYTMRRIRGRSLAVALDGCVSLDERLSLLPHFIDVVQTVGYAHSRRVVHRDLKPENVMVSSFGETQVIDWGLAVVDDEPPEGGVMAGTPSYMAPEQASGAFVDPRSDVWSLGVMLYELLAGKVPWAARGPSEVLKAVRESHVPPVRELEPHAPASLVAIVDKALSRSPEARYPNAGAMAEALEAAQRARAPRPVKLMVLAGALGAAALVFGLAAWSASSRADDAQRDARLQVGDAQRRALEAQAQRALDALRARDTFTATQVAEASKAHALSRGVLLLAQERGVPEKLWGVKPAAGCSALAVVGTTTACATLNGVELYGADGALAGTLPMGPTGWQHALVALSETELAAGGDDRLVRVFDVATRAEVRRVADLPGAVFALAWDGASLVIGLSTGEVLRAGADGVTAPVTRHARPVRLLAAQPGAVASASEGLFRLDGAAPFELDRAVGAAAFLSGSELALGVERSVVLIANGEARRVSDGHRDDVSALALVPADGATPARLVSASADGTVRWWYADGSVEGLLPGFAPGVQALAATPDGRLVVATKARGLEAWRLPPRRAGPEPLGVPSAHAWWPGAGLVTGYRDGRVRRFDEQSGEVHELDARHLGPVRVLAPNLAPQRPEAVRFLSGGDDGQLKAQRWNGEVETLDALEGTRVLCAAVTADGTRAAWAAEDGTRVLWSLEFGKEIHREKDTLVRSLAFSPDGRTLAVGRDDKRVALLDGATAAPRAMLDPIDGAATALAWSPDGALLIAGSGDGRLTTWDVAAHKVLRTLAAAQSRVTTLSVSANGQLLAAGSDDGQVALVELATGALAAQVPTDSGDVLLVQFTPEGLVTVGSDRVVHRLAP